MNIKYNTTWHSAEATKKCHPSEIRGKLVRKSGGVLTWE